jgi:hypothetical protein
MSESEKLRALMEIIYRALLMVAKAIKRIYLSRQKS